MAEHSLTGLIEDADAKALLGRLASIDPGDRLTLWIDSLGGDAFAGLQLHNALRRWPGWVEVRVENVAASASSVIAMAGDEVILESGATMMVHLPTGEAEGTAREILATTALLDRIAAAMAKIYSNRTGLSPSTITDMMERESWLSAEEAIRFGFADAIGSENTARIAALAYGGRVQ